jgi:hypothetical protein
VRADPRPDATVTSEGRVEHSSELMITFAVTTTAQRDVVFSASSCATAKVMCRGLHEEDVEQCVRQALLSTAVKNPTEFTFHDGGQRV